jgi:integrase
VSRAGLPIVLSPEEVGLLLASARNIKHKALLSLAYATGPRASEVVSLKLTDHASDWLASENPSRRRPSAGAAANSHLDPLPFE